MIGPAHFGSQAESSGLFFDLGGADHEASASRINSTVRRTTNLPTKTPAFYREAQLVPGMLPFSSSTLWRLVERGDFPPPVKLSRKVTAWPASVVHRWIREHGGDFK